MSTSGFAIGAADDAASRAARFDDTPLAPRGIDQPSLIPAVIVCVGGTGIEVGEALRKLRSKFVVDQGNTVAARQQADSVVLIGVDSWKSPSLMAFGAGNYVVIPEDHQLVNDRVRQHWSTNEDFAASWVGANGDYHRPGDFHTGAGQDRAKGRLGWSLNMMENHISVSMLVKTHVTRLLDALGPVGSIDRVPIYIVRGISGGTGSGIGGAIAVELRKALENNCSLIGVEILFDAAELKTNQGDNRALRANGAAALAEIDRIKTRQNVPEPFFRDENSGVEISIERDVFTYTYVFGAMNAKGLFLKNPGEVEAHAAACLAAEIFLPSTAGVHGPASQFIMRATEMPTHEGRSWTYASAALSELRYEPGLVAGFLATTFARTAVHDYMMPSPDVIENTWAEYKQATLTLAGNLHLTTNTARAILNSGYPNEPHTPAAPALSITNPAFVTATKTSIQNYVAQIRTNYDEWLSKPFAMALDRRRMHIQRNVRGGDGQAMHADGALFTEFERQLANPDGRGVQHALGFLRSMRTELDKAIEEIHVALDGPMWRDNPANGANQTLATATQNFESRTKQLATQMSQSKFMDRSGKKAKTGFVQSVWTPLATSQRTVMVLNSALSVLQLANGDIDELERQLVNRVKDVAQGFRDAYDKAERGLNSESSGGQLDDVLLSKASFVHYVFKPEVEAFTANRAADFVADHVLGNRGLVAHIAMVIDGKRKDASGQRAATGAIVEHALGYARSEFFETADKLTVWSALHAEMRARMAVNEMDKPLQEALIAADANVRGGGVENTSDARRRTQIERYAEYRLRACLDRAAPWWRLDTTMRIVAPPPAAHQRPYKFTIIGYDKDAYESFVLVHDTDNFLSNVTRQLGVNPTARRGKNSLTIYNREGLVPLFYLDQDRYCTPMLEASTDVKKDKPLMTDARFSTEIVEFDPPETASDRRRLLIAAGLYFGLIESTDNGDMSFVDQSGTVLEYPRVGALENEFALDKPSFRWLAQAVGERAASLGDMESAQTAANMRDLVQRYDQAARKRHSADDQRWWQQVGDVLKRRKRRGSFAIL